MRSFSTIKVSQVSQKLSQGPSGFKCFITGLQILQTFQMTAGVGGVQCEQDTGEHSVCTGNSAGALVQILLAHCVVPDLK